MICSLGFSQEGDELYCNTIEKIESNSKNKYDPLCTILYLYLNVYVNHEAGHENNTKFTKKKTKTYM